MTVYLYLSLIPEALIASMLPPEDFGAHYAVGSAKRSRGQAIFFEVDRDKLDPDAFPLAEADRRCVAQPDGAPKRSVYLSIYRTLENVPLDALRKLYLTTDDGRVLGLSPRPYEAGPGEGRYLYQEFCPVTPRVVSRQDPAAFSAGLTDATKPFHVPRLVFCDLTLGDLKDDPDSPHVDDLPYPNIGHLRDCLRDLRTWPTKQTKSVLRQMTQEVLFRTIEHGFYVGDATGIVAYPMPSRDELEREHYAWWRSAQMTFGA
ncbi:MAG: hypothetical protein U0Q15_09375 [Kineosporiaceae bacterium]